MTVTKNIEEATRVNTEIQSISGAVIAQTIIRYAAYIFIAWLALSFLTVGSWLGFNDKDRIGWQN
jgi:hypothetical protein